MKHSIQILHSACRRALLLGVAALTALSASAASYTWNGEGFFGNKTRTWSDPFNWDGGVAPSTNDATISLVFPNDDDVNTTNDIAGLVVDSLSVSGTNYTFYGRNGGTNLTIYGSAPFFTDLSITGTNTRFSSSFNLILSNEVNFNVATNRTFIVDGLLRGSGGFRKSGPGIMRLSGPAGNSYAGTTKVLNGRLEAENYFALFLTPAVAIPGPLIIGEAGSSLNAEFRHLQNDQIANSSAVTVNTNGTLELVDWSDTITSLTLAGDGRVQAITGPLTVLGNITSSDYPQIYGNISLGGATRTVNVTSGGLYVDAVIQPGGGSGVGLTKTGPGYLDLGDANTFDGTMTVAQGVLYVTHSQGLGTTAGGTVVSNGASLTLWPSLTVAGEALTIQGTGDASLPAALTFSSFSHWTGPVNLAGNTTMSVGIAGQSSHLSGAVTGPGALIKVGAGTLGLSGSLANTFSGGLYVNEGVVLLAKTANVGAVSCPVFIGDGVGGANADELRIGSSYANFEGNTPVTINSSGRLNIDGYFALVMSVTGVGPVTLGVNGMLGVSAYNDVSYSGVISGTSSFVNKHGPARWTLTGASTFTGTFIQTAGTSIMDGSLANADVRVDGGTFGGSGLVKSIRANSGGTLAPGASPGQLDVSGAVTLMPGSTYQVELNGLQAGTSFDQLNIGGPLNVTNATLQVIPSFNSAVSNVFTVVLNNGAGAVNGTFNGLPQNATFVAGGKTFRISYTGGSGNEVTLTQANTAPAVTSLISDAPRAEGTVVTLSGTFTEPDAGDTVKVVVNWGDGRKSTNNIAGSVGSFAIPHIYADDDPSSTAQDDYLVTVNLSDSYGALAPGQNLNVTITNVPPNLFMGVAKVVPEGQAYTDTLSFFDVNADTWIGMVNYNDGSPIVDATVNPAAKTVELSHTYPTNGIYTIAVLVRDDDLGETIRYKDVIVGMKLNITPVAPSNVRLSWAGVFPGMMVQTTTNFTDWTYLLNTPQLVGNEYRVTLPRTNPAAFFRLNRP
jgi:fibronectin-binding autotransporter adhesin